MLPDKHLNIYPKNEENIKAVLLFYLADYNLNYEGAVEYLLSNTALSMNQIQFIVQKLSEAYKTLFKSTLGGTIEARNLLTYGIDALTLDEGDWIGSVARNAITKKFKEFVETTSL